MKCSTCCLEIGTGTSLACTGSHAMAGGASSPKNTGPNRFKQAASLFIETDALCNGTTGNVALAGKTVKMGLTEQLQEQLALRSKILSQRRPNFSQRLQFIRGVERNMSICMFLGLFCITQAKFSALTQLLEELEQSLPAHARGPQHD